MKANVYPLIVTAWEALENALRCTAPVVYVDGSLYERMAGKIHDYMTAHDYQLDSSRGKHGVFFLKVRGENPFGTDSQEIFDPMDIL